MTCVTKHDMSSVEHEHQLLKINNNNIGAAHIAFYILSLALSLELVATLDKVFQLAVRLGVFCGRHAPKPYEVCEYRPMLVHNCGSCLWTFCPSRPRMNSTKSKRRHGRRKSTGLVAWCRLQERSQPPLTGLSRVR